MSVRNTVALSACAMFVPAASSTAWMLSRQLRVCSRISGGTWPERSVPTCPDVKIRLPKRMPGEYGEAGRGRLDGNTDWRVISSPPGPDGRPGRRRQGGRPDAEHFV